MKALLFALSLVFSVNSFSCQCMPGHQSPLSPNKAVIDYISNYYGVAVDYNDVKIIKSYPTLLERAIWLMDGSEPNSCWYKAGDNYLFSCELTRKLRVMVKIPNQNCEVYLKVKTTPRKSSVKETFSTCL